MMAPPLPSLIIKGASYPSAVKDIATPSAAHLTDPPALIFCAKIFPMPFRKSRQAIIAPPLPSPTATGPVCLPAAADTTLLIVESLDHTASEGVTRTYLKIKLVYHNA